MAAGNVAKVRQYLIDYKLKIEDLELLDAIDCDDQVKQNIQDAIDKGQKHVKKTEKMIDFAEKFNEAGSSKGESAKVEDAIKMEIRWRPIKFDGHLRSWLSFWDQYRAQMHERKNISNDLKFKCLMECLEGSEAKECLGTLALTGCNYEAAINTLKSTYNVASKLQACFFDELAALEVATDAKSQRQTLDKVKSIVRNLDAVAEMVNAERGADERPCFESDTYVKREVLRKFPPVVLSAAVKEANRECSGGFRFTVAQLLEALETEVGIGEYIAQSQTSVSDKRTAVFVGGAKGGKKVSTDQPGTSGQSQKRRENTVTDSPKKTRKTERCVFCEKTHDSGNCRIYQTAAARKARMADLRLCYICCGRGHLAKECRVANRCNFCNHSGHNRVICSVKYGGAPKRNPPKPDDKGKTVYGTYLQTFTCAVHGTTESTVVRGLLDPGSESSFLNDSIANSLKLPVLKRTRLECVRFMDSEAHSYVSKVVQARLENRNGEGRTYAFFTTPCVAGDLEGNPLSLIANLIPRELVRALADDIHRTNGRSIELLIGADLYYDIVNIREVRKLRGNAYLLKSFFGWLVAGNLEPAVEHCTRIATMVGKVLEKSENGQGTSSMAIGEVVALDGIGTSLDVMAENGLDSESEIVGPIEVDLQKMWDLDVLGIENPEKFSTDEYVLEQFRKTRYIQSDGRYCVRLPWKRTREELPTNFRMALARLKSLVANTSPETLVKGERLLLEQLESGIIEEAPKTSSFGHDNKASAEKRVHYLPHRWLVRKNKIRIVYDASARTKTGRSLNQLVHQGMKLTEDLVRLLLNFRMLAVGLTADIEKAYLQIGLSELDRDATRFLWVKDYSKPITQDNLRYFRFARVPFGINASPFLLNMVLQDVFAEIPANEVAYSGRHKFYVDNLVASVATPAIAVDFYHKMVEKLGSIKMNLRDWYSNDEEVLRSIPAEKRAEKGIISILGLQWNPETDALSCKMNVDGPRLGTKENVLKFMASIYDPLGLFTPCLVEIKLLIQKCWKNKFSWHEVLPDEKLGEWEKVRNELLGLEKLSFPRRYFMMEQGSYSLHIFCDASQRAYGCCAYLVRANDRKWESCLIFAKMRIAPMKTLTIPRLELMAVLLGVRTALFLRDRLEAELAKSVVWTDATTVLQWLQSQEILQPFVQNRITEIRKAADITIRHTPTDCNPADYVSRGKTPEQLEKLELWWKGPTWLGDEESWPQPPVNVEAYKPPTAQVNVTVLATRGREIPSLLSDKLEKASYSWDARVRIFGHVIRYCLIGSQQPVHSSESELFRLGEKLLIIELQRKYFGKEYNVLRNGGEPLTNLGLFLQREERDADGNVVRKADGIIRCKGRIQYAQFPWDTIHPMLLPRESNVTRCLIRQIHTSLGHAGASHVLAKLRERFWILKGRSLVKSVIHHCVTCRRWEGGSYQLPAIPPLPEIRIAQVAPFLHVGVDFFGPLHILGHRNEDMDVQVIIFACLVTRAVHLELVPNLSGEHFLMALERFTCLRRVPQRIISDNGSTFTFIQPMVGIKVKVRDGKVNQYLNSNRIEWSFIPQYAPWFGGAYERLIGLIKRSLKKSYGHQLLTYIEMQTCLARMMDIINSRPLTYVSSDEIIQPLTPNHFVKLGPSNVNVDLQVQETVPVSNTGKNLLKHWGRLNGILDAYWEAFRGMYLLSLRERHLATHPRKKGSVTFQPAVGDVVLVQEVSLPRAAWKMGLIKSLDVRQAVATVWVPQSKATILRSIRQLYPLEVQCDRPNGNGSVAAPT